MTPGQRDRRRRNDFAFSRPPGRQTRLAVSLALAACTVVPSGTSALAAAEMHSPSAVDTPDTVIVNPVPAAGRPFAAAGAIAGPAEAVMSIDFDGDDWRGELIAGRHDPGFDNLLMSGAARSGVTLHGETGRGRDGKARLATRVFGLSAGRDTDDIFDDAGTGGYLTGAGATLRPGPADGHDLEFEALTYFGDTRPSDDADIAADFAADFSHGDAPDIAGPVGTGSGWSAAVRASWFDRRLRLRAEKAATRFQAGNAGDGAANGGRAHVVRTSYDLLRGTGARWRLGAAWERVDPRFLSLTNPDMALDRESVEGSSTLQAGPFDLTLDLRREDNNVSATPQVPTDRRYRAGIDGRYVLSDGWLSRGALLFGAAAQRDRRVHTPAGYGGGDTDSKAASLYFGIADGDVAHDPDDDGWRAVFEFSDTDDRAAPQNSRRGILGRLAMGWSPAAGVALSVGAEAEASGNGADSRRSYRFNGTIGLRAALLPRKLDFTVEYGTDVAFGGGGARDGHRSSGELAWTLRPQTRTRPGIALILQGAVHAERGRGAAEPDNASYEGFLRLRISAPASAG